MAKSIKLSKDTYLDSTGIVHDEKTLHSILESNFANKLDFVINDSETKSIDIEINRVYLFVNSHTLQRSILLITTCFGALKVDTIFKSSDTAVPTITMEGNTLKISTSLQARGYLFKINNLYCA